MTTTELFIEYVIIGLLTVIGILIIGVLGFNWNVVDTYKLLSSDKNNMINLSSFISFAIMLYPLGMIMDNICKFITKPFYKSSFALSEIYYYRELDDLKYSKDLQGAHRNLILKYGNASQLSEYKRQKHYTYILRTIFVLCLAILYTAMIVYYKSIDSKITYLIIFLFLLSRISDECVCFFRRNSLLLYDYLGVERSEKVNFRLTNNLFFRRFKVFSTFAITLLLLFLMIKNILLVGITNELKMFIGSLCAMIISFLMYYYRMRKWLIMRKETIEYLTQ